MCTEPYEPEPPFLLFDDDDWLEVYDVLGRMLDDLEYPSIDEVLLVSDSNGHPLHLAARDGEVVVGGCATSAAIGELRERVETFFTRWTDSEPPEPSDDPGEYVQSVVASYRIVPINKRPGRRGGLD